VALAKLVVGIATNSLTLVSDAAHSAVDGVNNIVGLVAVGVASKEADADHPYGHSKFETLAAFGLSGFLFFTCYEIVSSAIGRLIEPPTDLPVATWQSFAVALGTLVVNFGVARWENKRGRELGSDFLVADATHTRSDLLVTTTVLVSLLLVSRGIPHVDAIFSLLIAIFIGRLGYSVFRRTLPILVDASAVEDLQVQRIVRTIPGVLSAHAVRSRRVGDTVFLEMHLIVQPTDTATDHARTEAVEKALEEAFGPTRATIHLETERDCGF
jgi:cation diffusion facilitator family transporter